METRWRETPDPKNGGGTVQVKIELIYIGNSNRPVKFKITETINGLEREFELENNPATK